MEREGAHARLLDAEGVGDTMALLTWVAFGAAVVGQKPPEGGDSHPARAQQTKPVQPIIFRLGWEWGVSGRSGYLSHPELRLLQNQV